MGDEYGPTLGSTLTAAWEQSVEISKLESMKPNRNKVK